MPALLSLVVVMSDGRVSTGGVVSTTVTVTLNDAEPVFPWLSVALQVTIVVPGGKVLPDGGLKLYLQPGPLVGLVGLAFQREFDRLAQ